MKTRVSLISTLAMEIFLKSPGLQHIAENVFLNLNYKTLKTCRHVNKICKQILDNPMFWIKKFIRRGLSKDNQIKWSKAIQITKNTGLKRNVLRYLKQCSKNERAVDIPCYITKGTLLKYSNIINALRYLKKRHISKNKKSVDITRYFSSTTKEIIKKFKDDPNRLLWEEINQAAGGKVKSSFIHTSFSVGNTARLQILSLFIDNYNAFNQKGKNGRIYEAAIYGHTEVVRILAPLTDNPNAPDVSGLTPIHRAAFRGHTEIVKILTPLRQS